MADPHTTEDQNWIEERGRRMRRHKVEAMLEAFDLTTDEFLRWLNDQVKGNAESD